MTYKRTAKIKVLDEVNCVIVGLTNDHIEWFSNRYAKHVPNYYFNPKFKLGTWDGKIQFFHKTGKTYTYLLNEIVPKLQSFGYKLQLIDNREPGVDVEFVDKNIFAHITNPKTRDPFVLRYYQVDAINAVIENGGGVVLAGTASGKTIINAALCKQYGDQGLKTITIVPSVDLITQTKDTFCELGLNVGEYSGDVKDINHDHIVSTWQSLQNNQRMMQMFNMVVVDECHGAKASVMTELLNKYGKNIQYRFGLTGTIPKAETDAMSVHIAVGPVVYEIPAHKLIEEGFLAVPHIDIFVLEENFREQYNEYLEHEEYIKPLTYRQFKDSYFAEWTDEKNYIKTKQERLEWIAHYIELQRDSKKGNVLCLISGIPFGKRLTKMVDGAVLVYGKDKKKVRKEIYDLFENNNNLVVVANVQIAGQGLSIDRIFKLMLIDVGNSFIRVIQSIGRGLRRANDKERVHISDIGSDLKYGRKHTRERIKYYSEAKYPFKKHVVKYDE